jgi:hypothetical protein
MSLNVTVIYAIVGCYLVGVGPEKDIKKSGVVLGNVVRRHIVR